jgi:hypothetical protein
VSPQRLVFLLLVCLPVGLEDERAAGGDRAPRRDVRDRFFERTVSEPVPADTPYIRYVRLQSQRLTTFHHRPVFLRAGVLLPRRFMEAPDRRYPLWVRMGGFGSRCTFIREFGSAQDGPSGDQPAFVMVCLDGAGPYGDPSQVNSANNGPYGDALTRELIPHIEREFRCLGRPNARFLSGTSTGGWAALALQVFYPDFFNGAYAFWPDPVDFRAFETINIYADENAYTDAAGRPRAAKRTRSGRTETTVREACEAENEEGGGSYTLSGQQWGAWNAIHSPRGADGKPAPLWDPKTGTIDRKVAEHWKRYDLRLQLERNWRTLGPKLRRKLHVWVGERDEYFLNDAVHLLHGFLSRAHPPFAGTIFFDPDGGHGDFEVPRTRDLLQEMTRAMEHARAEEAGTTTAGQ